MAAQGCTVVVWGLPTDLDEDRLIDKLYIHFLRGRHGGGEITSVTITTTTPASALITFEDSQVAQSVVQYEKHVLLVDNKEYKLTVSFPRKEVNVDEVFTSMMVTVNYSLLPLGKEAVTNMQGSSPEIQRGFDLPAGLCTLSGRFSAVQATIAQLLGLLEKPDPFSTCLAGTWLSAARGTSTSIRARDASHGGGGGGLGQGSPQTVEGSRGINKRRGVQEDYDHSLIVDIDTFRYLQKYCAEKYKCILSQHDVEAVDVTVGGVTALFLQAKLGQASGEEGLRKVRRDLASLCRDVESGLCREQLLKESGPQRGLQQALEALQLQLPQVLLGQDAAGEHITIVGSRSDVMEAKQFLLDFRAEEEVRLRLPGLGGAHLMPASDADRLDASTEKAVKTCMGGSLEGGREYGLAASFWDTTCGLQGKDKLGTRRGNTLVTPSTAFMGLPSVPKQRSGMNSVLGSGPVLSSGQISGKEGPGVGAGGLNLEYQRTFSPTGQDNPLEVSNPLSAASVENMPLLSCTVIESGPPNVKLQVRSSPASVDLSGVKRAQTAHVLQSDSSLKTTRRRPNSFAGYARNKQDHKDGDTGGNRETLSRGKVSTQGISREEQEMYGVEVQAPKVMWEYMKEVYRTRLENIISGSEMKESQSDSGVTTINLRGVEPSVVDNCQQELKNLLTMVATDFTVLELPLARLGVANPQDETLEICCAEVRSRFRKVKTQQREDTLVVIGPRQLCNQVVGALLEVFNDGIKRRTGQRENPSRVGGTVDASLTTSTKNEKETLPPRSDNLDQSAGTPFGSQEKPETQMGEETRTSPGGHQQNVQKVSGGGVLEVSQSAALKEPIIVEKRGKDRPKGGKHSRANAALFTYPLLASSQKEAVTAGSGPLAQYGLGKPHYESKDQSVLEPQASEGRTSTKKSV